MSVPLITGYKKAMSMPLITGYKGAMSMPLITALQGRHVHAFNYYATRTPHSCL